MAEGATEVTSGGHQTTGDRCARLDGMGQDLPTWAQRIRRERVVRGWSQSEAVAILQAHGDHQLPSRASLLRRWKAWEAGEHVPSDRYQILIATMYGSARYAIFPAPSKEVRDAALMGATGLDTLGIVARLRSSDVDPTTLHALTVTVDRLATEYAYVPAAQLIVEGRDWLAKVADLRNRQLTLDQHREVLSLAGWLALLVGCVEYDSGDLHAAEATRQAALSLGKEAGNGEIQGWAYEMRAWFALNAGDLRGVIAAARHGTEVADGHGVTVQLAAQEAKAWAGIGDRRQVELALERGRTTLDALPYPDNPANHFVVDPAKWDFYAMNAYRLLGEDTLAESLAQELLRSTPDGRSPMRRAEAEGTLGLVAARRGDLDQAVALGTELLAKQRVSRPSLRPIATELADTLRERFSNEPTARGYLELVRSTLAG
jgi:hypothetical protein